MPPPPMSWYRKYPLFATGLTVCGLVLLGELAFIYERFDASRNAAKRLEQRKGELAAIEQIAPPPTREVAAAIEADLAKAQKSLASMHTELTGKGPAAEKIRTAKVPAARTDSFFDLATFMEKMREQAEKNGVEVRSEAARFGFAKYANEGPEMDRIEPVFRQRQIAEYLLESLFEAKPRALFAVKRERTQTKAEREARAAAEAAGTPAEEVPADSDSESPDYFIIDPRVSARVKGYLDTTPFRFVFTGQTATLRNFLNRLAAFELPVLVREVEVDSATAEEAASSAANEATASATTAANAAEPAPAASVVLTVDPAAAKAGAAKPTAAPRTVVTSPIVSKSLSKYTVTVELVAIVAPGATPEAEPAPNPTPTS
jgi:hypothetical protein